MTKLALLVLALSACARHKPAPATPLPAAPKVDQLVDRCERDDDPAACYAAGYVFDHGLADQAIDHDRADRLAQHGVAVTIHACQNRNDPRSCRLVAAHLKVAIARVDRDDARRQLTEHLVSVAAAGCYAGDLDLCLDAAAILVRGDAGKADPDFARVLVEHACEAEHREACVDLAVMIVNDPRASADDHHHADVLLERACAEHARGDGCAALATLRLRESRLDDARRVAARACELADAGGCAVFGHCLIDGLGGPSDRAAAVPAFRKACSGGDDRGCRMLAALGEPR